MNGGSNVTITGSVTLTILNGTYHLVIYATDLNGNTGWAEVYFTIAIPGTETEEEEEDDSDDGGFLGICGPTILIGLIIAPVGFLARKFKLRG